MGASSVVEPVVELELAEPYLRQVLSSVGLDIEYVRAVGNTLFYRDEDGEEIPVLDLAGGFGSLILGHNNADVLRCVNGWLDAQVPVHAQFSRHPYANRLAAVLSDVVRRESGESEPFRVIFGNSGGEAVEIAIKHAELDRGLRVAELVAEVSARVAGAGEAVAAGRASVGVSVLSRLGLPAGSGFDRVAESVAAHNAELVDLPPVFFALEGGFHGKLVGSVQVTHNEAYRAPFTSLGKPVRFVASGDAAGLSEAVQAQRRVMWSLEVAGGVVELVEREFPVVGGFFVEPIQGEAGIRVLDKDFAAEIERVCALTGAPLIVDEIQSGMGRSGTFLASTQVGLRGDYYLFAKSLGGGVVKSSVMLVRGSRYRQEFELVHSSTFAKDALSCYVGLKVMELLEADGGRAYRLAAERGAVLRARLEQVAADFPGVVREVRGLGLMLGFEFEDQSGSGSAVIADIARQGFFGFAVAGHLFRRFRIRGFPTFSAMNTLRFEPSIYLSDAEIDKIEAAVRDICTALRDNDGGHLIPSALEMAG